MVILLSICCVIFVIIQIISAQNPCKTPDNWNGNCIKLQECRSLYKLVRKDLPTEQRTFLRNSQCGRDGDNVLVCCPSTFTIDDLPSTQHCGKQVGDRIVGGPETSIYEFPWMALLHYVKPNRQHGFFCAGALIHENYMITVAHCVRNTHLYKRKVVIDFVRLGEHDLRSNPDCQQPNKCADPMEDIPVAEIIVHENYVYTSISRENDIALIRLKHAVPYTDFIRPICLPVGKLKNRNYDGYPMTVAGFGQTDNNASRSAVKLKLEVHSFNFTQCANNYRTLKVNLTNGKQLCANGKGGDGTCNYDGGAPLVAEDRNDEYSYLIGVVSLSSAECGNINYPDVYTRVDQYIDWILDHMKK